MGDAPKHAKTGFEIEHNFVCSTGHVTEDDATRLHGDAVATQADDSPCLVVYEYPEGFFVYCSPECDAFDDHMRRAVAVGYSVELRTLMRVAKGLNCKFLHLDRDGPKYAHVPLFDW